MIGRGKISDFRPENFRDPISNLSASLESATGNWKWAILFVLIPLFSPAQPAPPVTVRGQVYDLRDSAAMPAPLVLNKRTGTGSSAAMGATFSIAGLKTDTFLITAGGYEVVRICFRDSALKSVYNVRIGLTLKPNVLNPVAIYPVKDLEEIRKERENLGVEQTRSTSGVTDAVASPITYMYERFSREGKSRAAVAFMENEDRKRDVLKDLFRTYERAGVIDLGEEEYDSFINYLNMPDEFLRTASEYDLAVMIRQRFLQYRSAQQLHNQNQR